MKKNKKSIAAILTITLLFLCTACGKKDSDDLQNQEKVSSETTTKEALSEYDFFDLPETTTEKSLSELGFYDLSEMGNIFIEITGYDFSGDDPYVYYESDYSGKIWGFKNGYCYSGKINENNKITLNEIIATYTTVDNDTVYLYSSNEGNGTLMLSDRKVFSKFNTVIFTLTNNGHEDGWLIPYSAIDWDKGFCELEQETGRYYTKTTYFKLYLKK